MCAALALRRTAPGALLLPLLVAPTLLTGPTPPPLLL
jgi:hypothetical protein